MHESEEISKSAADHKSCYMVGARPCFRLSYSTAQLLHRHQKAQSVCVDHVRKRMGIVLCFYLRLRWGWQSHRRFTRRCSPIFKRMRKGVRLMIYYPVPLWKSKWILESAQLFKSRPGGMWFMKMTSGTLCVLLCVLASMCETASRPH